jgi:hypothetical protein
MIGCGPTRTGTPGLMMPAFSPAIASERVAEIAFVVHRDRADQRERRPVDDVGRIEPAAEPGLEQQPVRRDAGKGEEGRGRGDLEEGDRIALVRRSQRPATSARKASLDRPAV